MIAQTNDCARDTPVFLARCTIGALAALPAALLVVGAVWPPGRPLDVIAVTSILVWWVFVPICTLAGLLVPLAIPKHGHARRLFRATCFSVAALLLLGDFWMIGIGAGLKSFWWKYDLLPAGVFIALVLAQLPRRCHIMESGP